MKSLIKTLLIVIAFSFMSNEVQSQSHIPKFGFHGPDELTLWFKPNGTAFGDDYMEIEIGTDPPYKNECQWRWDLEDHPYGRGVGFQAGENTPLLRVRFFWPGDYTFSLTRNSEYSTQVEYVTVHLLDQPSILKAEAKKHCYNPGDPVLIGDFEFETIPEDFAPDVRVKEGYETAPGVAFSHSKSVDFCIDNSEGEWCTDEMTTDIFVVNRNASMEDVQISIGLMQFMPKDGPKKYFEDFDKLKKALKELKDVNKWCREYKNAGKFMDQIKSTVPSGVRNISDINVNVKANLYEECCNDEPEFYLVFGFDVDMLAGIGIDVPVPYLSIPGIGGLIISGEASIGITLLGATFNYGFGECNGNVAFPIPIHGNVNIAGGVAVVNRDVLSAMAVLGLDLNSQLVYESNKGLHISDESVAKLYAAIELRCCGFQKNLQKWQLYPELKQE